ncbi:hypothetical protein [Streptomyces sp. YU58]|uniref:hypothetical protein n=1 Tax=Streptomyces sp. SX92 TaxID=3158972 RepID=UPI0027BA758C|nr:hypothetical protein [Streptomyces coralus]WLW50258.1 hypothetical protein QU709_02310 [Streptomyces coralus]
MRALFETTTDLKASADAGRRRSFRRQASSIRAVAGPAVTGMPGAAEFAGVTPVVVTGEFYDPGRNLT